MKRFGACDRWLLRRSCTHLSLPRGDGTNALHRPSFRRSRAVHGPVTGDGDDGRTPTLGATVHASILTFTGDPDDLAARFDDLLTQLPLDNVRLQLVVRRPDGITV